jgi:ATP-dependent Clp protease ATP-binding subunit ClpA
MTTNAGSSESGSIAGFSESVQTNERTKVMKALEQFLRPEFINRVDEIVVFNRLNRENFAVICRIMLGDLIDVLAEKGIKLEYSEEVVTYLAEKGYSEKYGARNLRRLIQSDIEDELASVIVSNYRDPISHVLVGAENGRIVITVQK